MMQKDKEWLIGDGSRQGYVYNLAEGQRSPHLSTYTAHVPQWINPSTAIYKLHSSYSYLWSVSVSPN